MSTRARRELLVGVETLERCRGSQSGLANPSPRDVCGGGEQVEVHGVHGAAGKGGLKFQGPGHCKFQWVCCGGVPIFGRCNLKSGGS